MKKRLLPVLLALAMVLAMVTVMALADGETGTGAAGARVTITVKESGENGEGITGATVSLSGTNSTYQLTEDTSVAGKYAYVNDDGTYTVGADTYTYKVTAKGYKDAEGTITVASTDVTQEVTMTRIAPDVEDNSGLTVTPSEDNTTVEVTASGVATVTLPMNDNVGAAKATVETAEASAVTVKTDTAQVLKDIVKAAVKMVKVEVKKDGSTNVFATANNDTEINVSINGVTSGKTYLMFCVMDDQSVKTFGYKKATSDSLTITTNHLCYFGVSEVDPSTMTEEELTALNTAVKEAKDESVDAIEDLTSPDTPDTPDTPETPTDVSVTYTANDNILGGYVTVSGDGITTGATYVIRVTRGSGANRATALFTVTAEDNALKFIAQADAKISVIPVSNSNILALTLNQMSEAALAWDVTPQQ